MGVKQPQIPLDNQNAEDEAVERYWKDPAYFFWVFGDWLPEAPADQEFHTCIRKDDLQTLLSVAVRTGFKSGRRSFARDLEAAHRNVELELEPLPKPAPRLDTDTATTPAGSLK